MLKGKNAIITGASRGIGLAIAEKFAKEGANIAICSTRQEKSQEMANKLAADHGINAIGIGVDVSDTGSVAEMIKTASEAFESLDILVNNAGITKDNLLLRLSVDDWNDVINTNLGSVFHTTKAILRKMLKQRNGRIINISSVVGVIGNPGQSNYAASKAGIIGFSKSVAKEYASKGIICNVVAPGFIETDMTQALPKDYLDNIMKTVPLGRLGKSEEIANLTAFLASDEAGYMTGQVFKIDGGISM